MYPALALNYKDLRCHIFLRPYEAQTSIIAEQLPDKVVKRTPCFGVILYEIRRDVMNCFIINRIEHNSQYLRVHSSCDHFDIRKTPDSGRVIRSLKDGIVHHEGILLGYDGYGQWWALHTSNRHRGPVLVTVNEFGNGSHVVFAPRRCAFSPDIVIGRALRALEKGEPYNVWDSNCQHLVSEACEGIRRSRQIDNLITALKVGTGFVIGGVALAVIFDGNHS